MSKWLPIESAPKDGQRIMVSPGDIDTVVIASWGWGQWKDECSAYDDGYGARCDADIKPTHWMPLPDPPEGT